MMRPLKIAGLSAVIGMAGLLAAGCSQSQDQNSSDASQPAVDQSTQTAATPAWWRSRC